MTPWSGVSSLAVSSNCLWCAGGGRKWIPVVVKFHGKCHCSFPAIWARFKSRSHLPDGIGFSKLPVSSMLGWLVPTNTVSRRKQTWIVRLLRSSRSRHAISLRSPAQAGPLRYMSMLRVPPSDCCLSRGKTWPSRSSPGLKRSPSWPGNTRSAGSSFYQQVHTAEEALSEAFAPSSRSDDVLFYPPVTKAWLRQLVLALVFICQSSTRGVVELLRDLFDYRISLGTVHNSVHSAVPHARRINEQYDLSSILIGLLDEIFQAGDPVLVGVDAQSTFCFLLSPEEHRDADTWGVPAAGTGRPRLRSQGHHRRFRLGAPRRAPRGAA